MLPYFALTFQKVMTIVRAKSVGVPETKPVPSALQASLLSDMDLPLRQSFFPLGFAVEILTNDPDVLVAASESFGHRRLRYGATGLQIRIGVSKGITKKCPPPPIRRQFEHLYTMVADPQNQAVLDLKTGTNFIWIERSAVLDRGYLRQNFLEKIVYLLLGAATVTDIHAGCVSREGKGILLCGNSGAGKSTLAYGCARSGWTFTSDDTCYLLHGGATPHVIGHSHRVRFRPEARDLFPELAPHAETLRMEGKPSIELPVTMLPLIHTATEASVKAIVYIKRVNGKQASLQLLPKGTGALRLSEELFSAGDIRLGHVQHLETLAETPTFELQYEALNDGIAALQGLLSRI
jgi:hypothetical protein